MIHQTIIGVDPAFRKGGFWVCILDFTDRTAQAQKFENVLDFDRWLRSAHAPIAALVCVENSNAQNVNFDTSGTRNVTARKGRNVGANQAVSQLTVQAAIDTYGELRVVSVSPLEKGKKITDPKMFLALVKSDGFTLSPKFPKNQDARDAYKIAWAGRQKQIMQTA